MTTITFSIDDELLTVVEKAMKRRKFSSRSEFMRDIIRSKYIDEYDETKYLMSSAENKKILTQSIADAEDSDKKSELVDMTNFFKKIKKTNNPEEIMNLLKNMPTDDA